MNSILKTILASFIFCTLAPVIDPPFRPSAEKGLTMTEWEGAYASQQLKISREPKKAVEENAGL